jgi:hypothetical protein
MPYIRTRKTKAGSISTTLVEAYRDAGRPRQRVLANLHGEPDMLSALGKLAMMRRGLLNELERNPLETYEARESVKGAGFVLRTERAVAKHDARVAQIYRQLDAIDRDAAVIGRYCTASDDEIEAAAEAYRKRVLTALGKVMALGSAKREADAELRRLYRTG